MIYSPSIEKLALDLEILDTNYAEKLWVQYTTGIDFGVDQAQQKISEFMKDKTNFKMICDAKANAGSDTIRGIEILHKAFQKHHYSKQANDLFQKIQNLQNSIMAVINLHRSELDGRELNSEEIGKILSESPDRTLRKKAYESRIPLNKKIVDAGFIDLLNLRKEYALACGAADFISLRLEEDDLSPQLFDSWKKEAIQRKAHFQNAQQTLAKRHLGLEDLKPWDYGFLKTTICKYNRAEVDMNQCLEVMAKTFDKFGFDIRSLNLTYDIFPRKNKSEWGYNFTIKPGQDSRVLANVSNRLSDYWVLLHETAHGVHFLGLDPKQKLLNRGVSGIVAEGFANFFGDLTFSKELLSNVLPASDIEEALGAFQNLNKVRRLQNFESLAITIFDQELYKKEIRSIQDIHDLRWSINEELFGQEPYSSEPVWAHLIHHTGAPIYLHNYFLGDVMCENMKTVFKRHTGNQPDDSPLEFGKFWKEKVLDPSGELPLLELYEKVCEEKLSIGPFLDNCLKI